MEKFFATCPRGLEPLLTEDLTAVGASDIKAIPGGVHFKADWRACYAANLHSRIATRILWQVAHGRYAKEDDIYKLALDTPWPKWFAASQTIRVDVTAIKSPLKSLEFITLRIKDAVCDRFRADVDKRPSVDTREPDVRIHGFITAEQCTLYIDTSGAPLYQRGLRQKTVEAPLKENVAAGIIRLCMLTGARLGEVRTATFDQFNLDLAIWTKQAAYTKQRRIHRVPISHEAVALIRLRREIVPKGCPFLFPGDVPDQPVGDPKRFWREPVRAPEHHLATGHGPGPSRQRGQRPRPRLLFAGPRTLGGAGGASGVSRLWRASGAAQRGQSGGGWARDSASGPGDLW